MCNVAAHRAQTRGGWSRDDCERRRGARPVAESDGDLVQAPLRLDVADDGNPEGGGHGCPPFSDRGRMPSRTIPILFQSRAALAGKAVSFGGLFLTGCAVRFAVGQQRKVTRSLVPSGSSCVRLFPYEHDSVSQGQELPSAEADGFISFGKRQKKRTKEKRFPRKGTSSRLTQDRDFPTRHPWLGRKTPHIHVRRPPGLEVRAVVCQESDIPSLDLRDSPSDP